MKFKIKIRRVITFVIIVAIAFQFPVVSFAQEASESAQILGEFENIGIATPSPSVVDEVEEVNLSLEDLSKSIPSASFRVGASVRSLRKNSYRFEEKITVVVDNARAIETKIEIFNSDGKKVNLNVSTISDSYPAVFKVSHSRASKPGRYRLKVTTSEGEVIIQDFTWGVLAINPNKSIYLPNETAKLSIAVLDEVGLMVCNASVELRVTNQELGVNDLLSTENGLIKINDVCQKKEFTLTPDYEAEYQLAGVGTYEMELTSVTDNGEYTINDAIEVRRSVPFEVERISATRLFPPLTYPMTFNIVAHEDFDGIVTETVPGNFAISGFEGTQKYTDIKVVQNDTLKEQLNEAIFGLVFPGDEVHPVNLGFGQQLRDPLLEKKYTDFGLIGHDGVDLDFPEGTPVLAIDDGEVVRVDPNGDYGGTVVIQHDWGKSYYGHMSLLTTKVGKKKEKGFPIGLSGSTGLSTGPHLHLGIKPNSNDADNGYYGKINPLPYLAIKEGNQNILGESTSDVLTTDGIPVVGEANNIQEISWKVSIKKGDSVILGYSYRVPNISPQFYLSGPLEFANKKGAVVFREARQWQLAIDADGSGTNTVSPTTGTVDVTGETYTFTFTAAEAMDSGEVTISVPSGWSAPQGTGGTAGYTTATGNGAATIADVWNNADSITNWSEDDADMCNTGSQLSLDTGIFKEGTGSIKCDNSASSAPDKNDSFSYSIANQDWSSYTDIGVWVRSDTTGSAGDYIIAYDNAATCSGTGTLEKFDVSALTADTWTYEKNTLTGTRTDVDSFCIVSGANGSIDNTIFWVDEILLGPGTPTFSGAGPWTISARILDAANTETISFVYGSGGGSSGVTNSSSTGVHTFTTQSKIAVDGTLTNISSSPTVTLSEAATGPTNAQLLRHGGWFDSGVEQPFTF